MAGRNFFLTRKILFVTAASLLIGGVVLFLHHTQANADLNASGVLIQSKDLLLDSSFDGKNANVESVKLSANAPQAVSDFGNNKFSNFTKWLYLSPNRKLIAVTVNPIGPDDVAPSTYISDINGSQLTSVYSGDFDSWAPDSSKVLLYVSPTEAPWSRKMYELDTHNNYFDIGLPDGTISADISPVDGSIAYSLTSGGTDASTIYVRDLKGHDQEIVKSDNTILAWLRWSPKGDKVAFMKSDLALAHGEVWTMNPDGTESEKASDIGWNYPPAWSPDGSKIAFSNAGDVWEYDPFQKSLRNVTNWGKGGARPNYSADGKTIVFASSASGNQQIWSEQNGIISQLTNDNSEKDYPILP